MVFIKDVSANADAGTATKWGGNDINFLDDYFDNVDITPKIAKINTRTYFRDDKFEWRNPADTFSYIVSTSAIAANRILTLPLLTADANFVLDSFANTFTDVQTIKKNANDLLKVYKDNSATGAYSLIDLDYKNASSAEVTGASLGLDVFDATAGSEDAALQIKAMAGGTLTTIAEFYNNTLNIGSLLRVGLDGSTGITAPRTYTFPDVTTMLAGYANGGTFTATQNINVNTNIQLSCYRPFTTTFTQWGLGFDANDSGANRTTYARFGAEIVSATDPTETGAFVIDLVNAGSMQNFIYVDKNEFDFRNTTTNYIKFLSTGITADRSITFQDSSYKVAAVDLNNNFTEKQTIKKDQSVLESLYRLTNVASNQVILEFNLQDSLSNETVYSALRGEIITNTDGSESGKLLVYTTASGSNRCTAQFDATGQLWCGGPNQRVALDETGLTTRRTITFQDVSSKQAALAFANIFTEPQTISKAQALQLTAYRPANTAGNLTTIALDAQSSTNVQRTYGQISSRVSTNTNGAEVGAVVIDRIQAGSIINAVWIDGSGLQFSGTGSNYAIFRNTGLTADRAYDFPDAACVMAAQNFANLFSATQDFQQQIRLSGDISPTQITSDQNDYNPTNLATSSRIRLDADSSFRSITGLQGGADGRLIILTNVSANSILLKDGTISTASSAANRFDFGGYDVPLLPSASIELMYDSTNSRWRQLTGGTNLIIPSPNMGFFYHNEQLSGNSADGVIAVSTPSGGTISGISSTANHPGQTRITLGTSATGNGGWISNNTGCLLLGNSNYYRFDAWINIDSLSTGTDTYTLRVGFIDSVAAESTDGVFFRYTHSVNTGKWVLVGRSNGTETVTNATNTAVAAATWYKLTIIVNPAGTSAEFFQDNVSLGTVTTNIPTGASRNTGFGAMFLKSAGTTNNNAFVLDAISVLMVNNVQR